MCNSSNYNCLYAHLSVMIYFMIGEVLGIVSAKILLTNPEYFFLIVFGYICLYSKSSDRVLLCWQEWDRFIDEACIAQTEDYAFIYFGVSAKLFVPWRSSPCTWAFISNIFIHRTTLYARLAWKVCACYAPVIQRGKCDFPSLINYVIWRLKWAILIFLAHYHGEFKQSTIFLTLTITI